MESSNKSIYVVMTFSNYSLRNALPYIHDSRLVGYFYNRSEAEEVVLTNTGDIFEASYDYAVIEEVEEGLYPCSTTRWFYKYNPDKRTYELIDEPHDFKHLCALTIG